MLPSKSPNSQSPFLLNPSHRPSHDGTPGPAGLLGANDDDSPSPAASGPGSLGAAAAAAGGGAGAGTGGGASAASGSTAGAASKVERYRPRIFGFPVHETAKLQRWQERQREIQIERLERTENAGIGPAYAGLD